MAEIWNSTQRPWRRTWGNQTSTAAQDSPKTYYPLIPDAHTLLTHWNEIEAKILGKYFLNSPPLLQHLKQHSADRKWHVHARVCLQTIPFRTPACKLTRITLGLCSLLVWAGKYLGSINTQGCGTREAQEFNYTPWQSRGSAVISVLFYFQ